MPNYATPPTAVAGQGLSAADWNAKVRDSMENLARPPRVRVARNTSLAIANAAVTMVPFQVVNHDSDAMWVAGTPSRLVVPAGAGGIWHVGFTGQFTPNVTGGRHFGLYVNGLMYASANASGGAWYAGANPSMDIYAAAGSYFECGIYQNSGGALNLDLAYPVAMWAHQIAR